MKDQHTKIKGYRDLSQEEIDMMNKCKELAEKCGDLVDELGSMPSNDVRWLKEGTMDLQKGFMSIIRSVAKPSTF